MLKFKPRRVNFEDGRTPVMSNQEIDEFAEAVLADYNSELLKKPGKIDMEDFVEYYIKADVIFKDIYYEDPTKPIRALTILNDGKIKIFDRDNNCVSYTDVPARAVVIDNEVTEKGKEGIELFSGLHEAGHIILHWDVFVDKYGNPYEKNDDEFASVICCQRSTIENINFSGNRTLYDWQEHQADYFAAAISMPNRTFRPFVTQILRENKIYKGSIMLKPNTYSGILADELLPQYISDTYGVSKRAARIKLRKCGYVYSINDIKL